MRSAVATVVVGVAAGRYHCPGSHALSHASMKVTVDADASCADVQQEIEARVNGGNWVDPHNGGIYSLLSSSDGLINTQRTTNPATAVGGKVYTDKQTFELTPIDGGGCQIKGCSQSQGMSVEDFSTNYCDLRNLYCGSSDGCVTAVNDFTSQERRHSGSVGAGHSAKKCITGNPPPPTPTAFSFVVFDGFCLDVPGGNLADGQPLWIWECSGTENQQFVFADGSYRITPASSPNLCLDAGGDMSVGNQISLWDCYGYDQQVFGYDSDAETIYLANSGSDASLCMEAEGAWNAAAVTAAWCDGQDAQRWSFSSTSMSLQAVSNQTQAEAVI